MYTSVVLSYYTDTATSPNLVCSDWFELPPAQASSRCSNRYATTLVSRDWWVDVYFYLGYWGRHVETHLENLYLECIECAFRRQTNTIDIHTIQTSRSLPRVRPSTRLYSRADVCLCTTDLDYAHVYMPIYKYPQIHSDRHTDLVGAACGRAGISVEISNDSLEPCIYI